MITTRSRFLLVPALGAALLAVDGVAAQDPDISHQRQVYREINNNAADMRKTSATVPGMMAPFPSPVGRTKVSCGKSPLRRA
jgi:hypothetical protein